MESKRVLFVAPIAMPAMAGGYGLLRPNIVWILLEPVCYEAWRTVWAQDLQDETLLVINGVMGPL